MGRRMDLGCLRGRRHRDEKTICRRKAGESWQGEEAGRRSREKAEKGREHNDMSKTTNKDRDWAESMGLLCITYSLGRSEPGLNLCGTRFTRFERRSAVAMARERFGMVRTVWPSVPSFVYWAGSRANNILIF